MAEPRYPSRDPAPTELMGEPARKDSAPSRPTWRVLAAAGAAMVAVGLGIWLLQPFPSFAVGDDGQEDEEAESQGSSREKARQEMTLRHIRSLGNAYMSWLTDQVGAAAAGAQKTISLETNDARLLTPEEVQADLHPSDTFFYMDEVSLEDGWGHSMEVWRGANYLHSRVLLIRSPGSDGQFEKEEYESKAFPATDSDRDIVWADGYFIQYPDGIGRR